jgi:hypothetical protein
VKQKKSEQFSTFSRWLQWGGIGITVAIVVVYAFAFWRQPIGESAEWGQLGDYVGGIAGTAIALFTLVAILKTLATQAEELELTREEMALARQEMQASNAALNQQVFEATFFRLLEQFREVVDRVSYSDKNGASAFAEMAKTIDGNTLEPLFATPKDGTNSAQKNSRRKKSLGYYNNIYENNKPTLGPYFRSLYHLLKFVHYSKLSDADKARYASLARAQLASTELVVIFANGQTPQGAGLTPYVEQYGILKHLEIGKDIQQEHTMGHGYADAAFQSHKERKASGWTVPAAIRIDPITSTPQAAAGSSRPHE